MSTPKDKEEKNEKKTLTLGGGKSGTLKLGGNISSDKLAKRFAQGAGQKRVVSPAAPSARGERGGRPMSDSERERRKKILESAPNAADAVSKQLEEDSKLRQHREAIAKQEAEKQKADDSNRPSGRASGAPGLVGGPIAPAEGAGRHSGHGSRDDRGDREDEAKQEKAPPKRIRREGEERRSGKITVTQALLMEEDEQYRRRSEAAYRRAQQKKKMQGGEIEPPAKVLREVTVPENISVQELANRMTERVADVVKSLMKLGVMATANQTIDADTAELVISEFGHTIKRVSESDVETAIMAEEDKPEDLKDRPPVVTIMGHVDHGKTSLLDAMRATDVAAGEAGGITQHIGAYQIEVDGGQKITFIDTPGHAAFSEMRSRGANVTDIVILVVAADDSIKEQTIEAISHAKAAGVPIIVAINKIDVPGADPMKVRTDLLQHELIVEEMGGDVLSVEVSAKQKQNLDKLVEAITLQAELLDLKANPDRRAVGVVVESRVERGIGPVATVLVNHGTLHVGDLYVTGEETGRVRALVDERGRKLKDAPPATPVEVWGLAGAPLAGDDFLVVENESQARQVADFRIRQRKAKESAAQSASTMEQMFSNIQEGQASEVAVVIKGDVQGSVEAIRTSLEKLGTDEVKVRVLHSGVGEITESDVTLTKASKGFIIGFNVRANPQAREASRRDGVDIRYYSIIYQLVDDLKDVMSGYISPDTQEKFLGYAEILEVFKITGAGKVAGCKVTEGVVKRGNKVRLLRDNVVIHEGSLKTLKRFKDEVKEVTMGMECGMAFEKYEDMQAGDKIECFEEIVTQRTL